MELIQERFQRKSMSQATSRQYQRAALIVGSSTRAYATLGGRFPGCPAYFHSSAAPCRTGGTPGTKGRMIPINLIQAKLTALTPGRNQSKGFCAQ